MRVFKSEKAWGEALDRELKNIPRSWWMSPPTRERRGIPDRIGVVNGFFVALELKLDDVKEDPSRESLQKYNLKKMREAGSPICVERLTPDTWPEVERKLRFLASLSATNRQSLGKHLLSNDAVK